jgi:hypothetical protein
MNLLETVFLVCLFIALLNQYLPIYIFRYISKKCFSIRLLKFIRDCPYKDIIPVYEICIGIGESVPSYQNVMEAIFTYKVVYDYLYKEANSTGLDLPSSGQHYIDLYEKNKSSEIKKVIMRIVRRRIGLSISLQQPEMSNRTRKSIKHILAKTPNTLVETLSYDKELCDISRFIHRRKSPLSFFKIYPTYHIRKARS